MLLAVIFGLTAIALGLNTLSMDKNDPKELTAMRGGRTLTFLLAVASITFAIIATVSGHGNF